MLIYVHKPTWGNHSEGRLVNTAHILRVDPYNFKFHNYDQGSRITFTNGHRLIVTTTVAEIRAAAQGQ